MPGGPVRALPGPRATVQQIADYNRLYGFDQPFYVQYVKWAWQLMHGNLGYPAMLDQPAASMIDQYPPKTMVLVAVSTARRMVTSMEFQQVVARRRMVRTFTGEPVSRQSLDRMLRNAVRGPSAGFSQGQAFLVLDGDSLPRFWEVSGTEADSPVRTAPLVIVPLSSKRIYLDRYALPDKGWTDRDEARWPVPFWHIDTGMATLLILLTAVDEGLGALYFGIVPEAVGPFRAAFGVPADHEPIGAVAIGHEAGHQRRDLSSRRRPLDQMVHCQHW